MHTTFKVYFSIFNCSYFDLMAACHITIIISSNQHKSFFERSCSVSSNIVNSGAAVHRSCLSVHTVPLIISASVLSAHCSTRDSIMTNSSCMRVYRYTCVRRANFSSVNITKPSEFIYATYEKLFLVTCMFKYMATSWTPNPTISVSISILYHPPPQVLPTVSPRQIFHYVITKIANNITKHV